MDWVPMAFHGDDIVLGPIATGYVILYPLPDYALGDQEFLVEDEDETGMFLERIVGDVHVSTTSPNDHTVHWQLMPLGVDYEAAAVLPPFTTDWTPQSSEWANLRMWTRRSYTKVSGATAYPYQTEIPYWTHVDINPRQMMGAKKNLWPCWVMRNNDPVYSLRLHHTLRALYK